MPLQCSTRQVDISRQLAGQQNLLRHIARWRRRFPLAAKATGSNPDGGKGAQGASTGLDLPRALRREAAPIHFFDRAVVACPSRA